MGALTRGLVGGITKSQHEIFDTLDHNLSENSFAEFTYTGKNLTSVIIYTSVTKTLKIRESTFTYTGKNLTGIVIEQFDGAGVVLVTLTKTLAYSGKNLISITVVRT